MNVHAPAPWVLEQDGDVYVRLAPDNVIRCMDERSDVATSQDYANARLIAAAPDLLKALVALHACHRAFSGSENWTALDDEAREFAEAAIAKATGEAA